MNAGVVSTLSNLESRFAVHLANRGRLNAIAAERLHRVLEETSDRLAAVVLKLGLLSEDDLVRELVEFSALPLLQTEQLPKEPVVLDNLNVSFFRSREVVPMAIVEGRMQIACWDSLDDYVVRSGSEAATLMDELRDEFRSLQKTVPQWRDAPQSHAR